jgi:hypothetical protein
MGQLPQFSALDLRLDGNQAQAIRYGSPGHQDSMRKFLAEREHARAARVQQ